VTASKDWDNFKRSLKLL